jgi:acyl-CoA thioester hydrolase
MKACYIESDIKVATYDIDFAGHVSNISYLRWLEDMRRTLFDKHTPFHKFIERGVTPVLVSTNIKYRKAVRLFDEPRGFMWISALTRTSLVIDAEIYVGESLVTEVQHTGVFIDLNTMKPIRLPRDFADAVHASKLSD